MWSTASRRAITVRIGKDDKQTGPFVQVSRLGQPLVNEVVIPMGLKDTFNSIPPTQDAAALPAVLDPEVPKLLKALFMINSPPAPRNDLVTIFLKGIPGLNQPKKVKPSEMLRLNVAIPPSASPNPLGVLGGDNAGFPNGRRVGDDVTDVALRVMAGATPLTPDFNSRDQRAAHRRRVGQRRPVSADVSVPGFPAVRQSVIRMVVGGVVDGGWWLGSWFRVRQPPPTERRTLMDSTMTVEMEGVASAQLVRPDVAQAKWLAFPFAALAWGMSRHMVVQGDVQLEWASNDAEPDMNVVRVEQLADFDAWRVGGGVAFRW